MSQIVDRNRLPEIQKVIEELKRYKLQVGIFAPEGSELFMIATVHEYGVSIEVTPKMRAWLHYQGVHLNPSTTHINIPERSYIRAGYDTVKDDVQKLVKLGLAKCIALEMKPKQLYELIGDYVVGAIHNYIAGLQKPPLSSFTVARKKNHSTKPLIDTGRLNQAVTWEVVDR